MSISLDWKHARSEVTRRLVEAAEGLHEPALVVVGDLSGIQQFIYAVAQPEATGHRTAVRLRARSLQLSTLCYSFCHHLCHRHGLDPACMLSVSGGNFIQLLPASSAQDGLLDDFLHQAEAWLWSRTWGELCLHVGVSEPLDDLSTGGWEALQEAYTDLHRRRLQSWSQTAFTTTELPHGGRYVPPLFVAQHHDDECSSCRRLPVAAGDTLCTMCTSQTEWGHRIVRGRLGGLAVKLTRGLHPSALEVFDGYILEADADDDGAHAVCTYAPTYEDVSAVPLPDEGVTSQSTATFEAIAAQATGAAKLAVLAIDADNMGWVMSQRYGGLHDNLTLSRTLNEFFGEHLVRRFVAQPPHCYLLYSGGDDIVLAGPWDRVIALACSLEAEFQAAFEPIRQTLGLPTPLTISGGIAIDAPTTPISDFAHSAHQHLQQAKDAGNPRGNRVQIGAIGCSWDTCRTLVEVARELHRRTELPATDDESISPSFVHQLYQVMELCDQWVRDGRPEGLRYKGLLVASMRRHEVPGAVEAMLSQHLMHAGKDTAAAFRLCLDWVSLAGRER